jgi:hypothetical protein
VNYLWKRAEARIKELKEQKEEAYVIWDESVLEKSESLQYGLGCSQTMPTQNKPHCFPSPFA